MVEFRWNHSRLTLFEIILLEVNTFCLKVVHQSNIKVGVLAEDKLNTFLQQNWDLSWSPGLGNWTASLIRIRIEIQGTIINRRNKDLCFFGIWFFTLSYDLLWEQYLFHLYHCNLGKGHTLRGCNQAMWAELQLAGWHWAGHLLGSWCFGPLSLKLEEQYVPRGVDVIINWANAYKGLKTPLGTQKGLHKN